MERETILLDPTDEQVAARRERVVRPAQLAGLTLGLLDISKPRGDVFLDELAGLLAGQGAAIRRYTKPTFARPAPLPLRQALAFECDGVIEALAD